VRSLRYNDRACDLQVIVEEKLNGGTFVCGFRVQVGGEFQGDYIAFLIGFVTSAPGWDGIRGDKQIP
jgi:hypothetical protein